MLCVFRLQPKEPAVNSIESILCEAIKLEYEAFYSVSQFNTNSRELNNAERAKLNELIVAHKALSTPIDDELNGLSDLNGIFGDEYRLQVKRNSIRPLNEIILSIHTQIFTVIAHWPIIFFPRESVRKLFTFFFILTPACTF